METNLQKVRSVAKTLLYVDIEPIEEIPFFVVHPIFTSNTVALPTKHDRYYDLHIEEDRQHVLQCYSDYIDKCDLLGLYMLMRDPYKMTFIKYASPHLSIEDLSHYFADAWVTAENPNQDVNCPLSYMVKMFKKCDKKILMNEKDYEVYQNLPDQVRVYRGVGVGRNPKGLSWTASYDKAKWFADRFNKKDKTGYVQTALADKENILAYFNTRHEDELVCDTRKLTVERMD